MILVAGATGHLGSSIVHRLLARGEQVRILARAGSAYQALVQRGAEVSIGDLKDRASLDRACAGIDTVITTANSARRGGDDNVDTVDERGTASLIDAAKAAGVRHFIYVSVLGVSADSPMPFLAAKGRNEDRLRASVMAWTILAPNAFLEPWPATVVGMPALAGQPVTIVGEGNRKHTFVSADDVAAFVVAAVGNRAALNQHVPIGGPDALSWRDVVKVYERVLGRSIEIRTAQPGESVPGVPPTVIPLLAGFDTYETVFDTSQSARAFGVTLTPLETIVRRQQATGAAH
jgi:NADH dehydrogenase